MGERDDERAFLVNEVDFTPEQADDATSGDIDRNGAASMLPGIIEALEQMGTQPFTDDQVLEMGIDPGARGARFMLTMLKLLQRARTAEADTLRPADIASLRKAADQIRAAGKPMEPVAALLNTGLLTARDIAVAVFDHIDTHGWDGSANGHTKSFDERMREASYAAADAMRASRARAVARLTEAVKGVVHRDIKPGNPEHVSSSALAVRIPRKAKGTRS